MAKKGTLAMLAMEGKPPPPGEEDGEAPMEDEGGEGLKAAMSDFLDAVKADDAAGMAAAFQDAMAMAE